MQYSQGAVGRVFTLRLEDDERVPDCIERFALEHDVKTALCTLLGGVDRGRIVAGPKDGEAPVIDPILCPVEGAHEVLGMGTLFPDEGGAPVLHLHAATGREGDATVGCSRAGVDVWLVGEVIILEILGARGRRRPEPPSGFSLLQFDE